MRKYRQPVLYLQPLQTRLTDILTHTHISRVMKTHMEKHMETLLAKITVNAQVPRIGKPKIYDNCDMKNIR